MTAAAITTLVSSCASSGDESADEKASLSKNVDYSSVTELRDAYVDAGGSCPAWKQTDVVSAALESGECDDATILSIYVDRGEAKEAAEILTSLFADPDDPSSVLVGPNWIINNDEDAKGLRPLKQKLGGTIETSY